jgi:beta-glucosidase
MLKNSGTRDALETVQCYIVPPRDWPGAPRATLVDFKKLAVRAGKSVPVQFDLPAEAFEQIDAAGHRMHHPGRYQIVVGSASPGPRAVSLGAPAPASAEVLLTAMHASLGAA